MSIIRVLQRWYRGKYGYKINLHDFVFDHGADLYIYEKQLDKVHVFTYPKWGFESFVKGDQKWWGIEYSGDNHEFLLCEERLKKIFGEVPNVISYKELIDEN